MGEWDCSQGHPMNPDIATGYPVGSTLDLDYRSGYMSGYRSYQAEIRAEKVKVWRNNRRALRGLKPIVTPAEYWSAECVRLDAEMAAEYQRHPDKFGARLGQLNNELSIAQGMYQQACDEARWKLRLGVPKA